MISGVNVLWGRGLKCSFWFQLHVPPASKPLIWNATYCIARLTELSRCTPCTLEYKIRIQDLNTRFEYKIWIQDVNTRFEYKIWIHDLNTRFEYKAPKSLVQTNPTLLLHYSCFVNLFGPSLQNYFWQSKQSLLFSAFF